ncbi:MAG: LamG domain-containing protein, partial [Gammaproteobacteria bacterium]
MYVVVDGVTDSRSNPNGVFNSTANFTVGRIETTGSLFDYDGKIDELRFLSEIPSTDWIATEYNNITDKANFFKSISVPEKENLSPILFWKFDEGEGNTASDTSPSQIPGTITNSTWGDSSVCLYGKCLEYDGAGDYVSTPDNPTLDFAASESFSISGWFKHDAITTSPDIILAKYEATGADGGYKLLMESDGDITFGISDDNTIFPKDSVTSTTANYDDNSWHHFAAVKNGATALKLYIDGQLVGTDTSIASTATLANNDTFYLGIDGDGSSNGWDGFIDEIKIYPFALSADQIIADFNSRGAVSSAANLGSSPGNSLAQGLAAYWQLDEASANTCAGGTNDSCDSSGNQHDGAWVGTTTSATGKFGNGVSFSAASDGITVSASSSFLPEDEFTISAWIYVNSIGQYNPIIGS